MRLPTEIRLLIYGCLIPTHQNKSIAIRNRIHPTKEQIQKCRRSTYLVTENTIHRRCYTTTYCAIGHVGMDVAIMSVNRRIHEEASSVLYGRNGFDFGNDLEAVGPFFRDRTPVTRALICEISLHKGGHGNYYGSDKCSWSSACRNLQAHSKLRKLRLVVQGGRPINNWDGPKELAVDHLRLLANIKEESLGWVAELAQLKDLEELEIVANLQYLPAPKTTTMLVFAAFSASIETSFVQYLRECLHLPAGVGAK
jgi:hypothetical protein